MPDIDPAALSRPAVSLSTPIISTKSLAINATGSLKQAKTSQIIPARIDLEPLYIALKSAINPEQWLVYKESTTEFLIGRLNQTEYSERIDPILSDSNGEKDHLHNQLIAAIYGNVTREMPDQGPAPWVSANDKPLATTGNKPVSGDAAERRLKGDVMQLPARDRRRIKDLVHNDYDAHQSLTAVFSEAHRRPSGIADTAPISSSGVNKMSDSINKMNFDIEIRKRFTLPLAIESGEFPDIGQISGRMLPLCYSAGLANGHTPDAPQLLSTATEAFIKEFLSQVFARTRSNGPGDNCCAGFGAGTNWIHTQRYKKQLRLEEDAAIHGELSRDKSGLLPVEAKAASERGRLGMGDVRIALEMADTSMSQFPMIATQILWSYCEGELESWNDYTWLNGTPPITETVPKPIVVANGTTEANGQDSVNANSDAMDIDAEYWWEGTETKDLDMLDGMLDGMLDSCLAFG